MAAASKNIVIGPATVSFSGSDIGALKKGSVEIEYISEHTEIGNNENLVGVEAVYHRFSKAIVRLVAEEATLANIKAALGASASIGSSNPATMYLEFEEGILTSGALVITGAAPRTTAGVAQTRTITCAAAVPTAKTIKMVMSNSQITEIPMEFTVLKSSGNDIAFSDVNA